MARAFLGLGSNLGDRVATLGEAVQRLAEDPRVRLRSVSHAYESEPWGVADQPAFANAVVSLEFDGGPQELLALCKAIEARLGRVAGTRWGPRPIDLDILLFGASVFEERGLTVPHPRLRERDFVVTPLLEVEPGARTPDGRAISRLEAEAGRVTAVLGPVPGFEPLTPACPTG